MRELCASCQLAPPAGQVHPWIGVMQVSHIPDGRKPVASAGTWAALAVCVNCHTHPENRAVTLKAHFFSRQQIDQALKEAGSTGQIGGTFTPPQLSE